MNYYKRELSNEVVGTRVPLLSLMWKRRTGSTSLYRLHQIKIVHTTFMLPTSKDRWVIYYHSRNQFFTNLDLKEAYFSLPIAVNFRKHAAVITHNGIFVPPRCQFWLKKRPHALSEHDGKPTKRLWKFYICLRMTYVIVLKLKKNTCMWKSIKCIIS